MEMSSFLLCPFAEKRDELPLGPELGAERLKAEGQPVDEHAMQISFIPFFGTIVKAP